MDDPHFLNDEDAALVQRVAAWMAQMEPESVNEQVLSELPATEGIDFATALLYQQIVTSPLHGPFIRRIRTIRRSAAQNLGLAFAIAPGAFYREHPQTGADGRRLREAVVNAVMICVKPGPCVTEETPTLPDP